MPGLRNATLILTVALLATAHPSFGGLNRWTNVGPGGASVTALATDSEGSRVIYAATDGGGVFRAVAGDETRWEQLDADLPEPTITALVIDPLAPALYAGTASGRIFQSMPPGDRWTELEKPKSGRVRGFAFDNQRLRIYTATETGLLTSRDGGKSWQTLPAVSGVASSVAATPNGDVYVSVNNNNATRSLLYVSRDGAATWQWTTVSHASVLAADSRNPTIYATQPAGAMARNEQGVGVIASSDSGRTWRSLPALDPSSADRSPILSLLSADRILYAGTHRGLFQLEDGDTVWRRPGTLTEPVTAMAVVQSEPVRVYAGTNAGVLTASPGSGEWKPADSGIASAFAFDVAVGEGDRLFAATTGGLFRSGDGGRVWLPIPAVEGPPSRVLTTRHGGVYASGRKGIYRGAAGGESWEMVTPRIPSALASPHSSAATLYAAFTDPSSGFSGAGQEKSTDGGRTWSEISSGLAFGYSWFYYGVSPPILETDRDDSATVFTAYEAGLFKSADEGKSWRTLLDFSRIYDRVRTVAGRGSVVHAGRLAGLTTSIDGGTTWSSRRLAEEIVQTIVIDPVDSGRSYAGTASGRVYLSRDFGSEWSLFSDGLRNAPIYRLATNDRGDRIYAATAGGVFEYQIGPAVSAERLPDDPLRLPRLLGQVVAGDANDVVRARGPAFVLPAVGTVVGARGELFRTDVTLANARSTGQNVLVAWLPQGNENGPAVTMFRIVVPSLSDGGVLTISDIADDLGLAGLGSMVVLAVNSDGDVDHAAQIDGFARVRSASFCGAGSVSLSLPAVRFSVSRNRARALGLRHERGFRTNFGIVNLDQVAREFSVVVQGERESKRLNLVVPPLTSVQAAIPDADYGAVALTVTTGGRLWVGYGSSVDNASGDAWASVAKPQANRE